MRWTGILVVLALAIGCAAAAQESPPEFSYALYSDEQGHFSYDGAALALVKRPSHLQRVYADAARGEARPRQLIQELEYWFQQTGFAVADMTAALGCLVLPELQSACRPPNWEFIEQFLGNSPEGLRLREVLAEAYARRAQQLGVRNDVTIAGVNLLLAGSLAKAVLARAGVVEARTAVQKSLVPEAKATRGIPDGAFVVRGGMATPEQIAKGIGPHRDVPGLTGFSAQSRAGTTVEEMAASGGVGGAPFPHGKVAVTTAGQLRSIGCDVVPSPGGGANHVTVTPGPASPAQISEQFVVQPNPARPR